MQLGSSAPKHRHQRNEDCQLADKEIRLITKLQQLVLDREALRAKIPPVTLTPTKFDWMVGSNEPSLPQSPLFDHGVFTVVGCGCLKTIEAAFAVIDFDKYQPSECQYKNVPKLLVIDNSVQIQKAWKILKKMI